MTPPKPKKRRDPLLDAADAVERGTLTHDYLRTLWNPQSLAEAHQQDIELGPVAAFGLGAARGASFGLGDLAQALALNKTEKAATAATAAEHPHLTTAGTVAGAALPFLLSGGANALGLGARGTLGIGLGGAGTAATLPGLGARATQIALGAAQGAGLTPGGVGNRAIGAGAGAGLAAAAPYIAPAASAVAKRIPLVGRLVGSIGSRAAPAVTAAAEGAPALSPQAAIEQEMATYAKGQPPLDFSHMQPDIRQAIADHAQGLLSDEGLGTAIKQATGQLQPSILEPIPGSPKGLLGPVGESPPPRASYPPTITEMQGYRTMPDIGTGKTMPYYPKGGRVEQAFGPQPVVSNPGPSPLALAQLKQLLQMSDADLEQVAGLFPPDIMAQVRQIRAQGLLH